MGWADNYISRLQAGETVSFRPRGNSMTPLIKSGQQVTIHPVMTDDPIEVGSVVLCRVKSKQYLHLVTGISGKPRQYRISNNHGHINGWTPEYRIYGVVSEVQD